MGGRNFHATSDPSKKARIRLVVTAPSAPGRYLLELDMVQENIAWFQTKGAPTARIPVDVHQQLVEDDGRSPLLHDLEPGEETTLLLWVKAPSEPGHYILELDMVQEHVAWFRTLRSGTARIPVLVR